jgi:hypothetical protein
MALPLKACQKKQENFHATLQTIDSKESYQELQAFWGNTGPGLHCRSIQATTTDHWPLISWVAGISPH